MDEKSERINFSLSPEVTRELEKVRKEKYADMSEEEVLAKLVGLGLKVLETSPELGEKWLG